MMGRTAFLYHLGDGMSMEKKKKESNKKLQIFVHTAKKNYNSKRLAKILHSIT
jgi:hypothetical protein